MKPKLLFLVLSSLLLLVIDTCREKESSYDPVNRMPLLLEQFASQASLKQRRGRAGRVRKGVCYKLISRNTYNKLKAHGDPEICRCALEQTLLSLLFLGFGSDFMGKLMDPPPKQAVDSALFSLRKLGAVSDSEGALTPLGMHLAGIPAPPSVGKRKHYSPRCHLSLCPPILTCQLFCRIRKCWSWVPYWVFAGLP